MIWQSASVLLLTFILKSLAAVPTTYDIAVRETFVEL